MGTDDAILRSTHAAAPTPASQGVPSDRGETAAEPALPIRSLDDSDIGWGESTDANDERLRRDKPPHW